MKTHTPGPFPLKITNVDDFFVIVTNQGNHYAKTFDPTAASLISSAPELLEIIRALLPHASNEWERLDDLVHRGSRESENAARELDNLIDRSNEILANIGTVGNGVFTAAQQKLAIEDTLLAACETVVNDCDAILDGDDMSGMSDEELFSAIKQTLTAAIAKAKGGAQ